MHEIIPDLVEQAVRNVDSLSAVYSQYIILWFRCTGKLAPGFDNKQLVKWIEKNMPGKFNENGKKEN